MTCQDESKGFLKVTKLLSVTVTNVNEAPYNIRMSNLNIDEGVGAGQLVGEIQATDPDSSQVGHLSS